jgi:hypothetical protein
MVKTTWRVAVAALGVASAVVVGITASQQQEPVAQTAFCNPVLEADGVVEPLTTDGGTRLRVKFYCRVWTVATETSSLRGADAYFEVGLPEARRNTAIGDSLAAQLGLPGKTVFFTPFMRAE